MKEEKRERGKSGSWKRTLKNWHLGWRPCLTPRGLPTLLNSDMRCEARWHPQVAGAEWRDRWSVICEARTSAGWSGCPQGGWWEARESRTMREQPTSEERGSVAKILENVRVTVYSLFKPGTLSIITAVPQIQPKMMITLADYEIPTMRTGQYRQSRRWLLNEAGVCSGKE